VRNRWGFVVSFESNERNTGKADDEDYRERNPPLSGIHQELNETSFCLHDIGLRPQCRSDKPSPYMIQIIRMAGAANGMLWFAVYRFARLSARWVDSISASACSSSWDVSARSFVTPILCKPTYLVMGRSCLSKTALAHAIGQPSTTIASRPINCFRNFGIPAATPARHDISARPLSSA